MPIISPTAISPHNRRGISWQAYWATQPEVLFFGLYSEISGGQMPNKVTGSSDFLTVAGEAGSETYQCPNTAPYIAADADYMWFKTDGARRTVTTAELIGYDLQRTPVKYEDDSPNEIVAIIILSSAVTGDKRDRLFRDMWLPLLWDNNLNLNGHIKDNRITQNLYNPFESELTTYTTGLTTPLSRSYSVILNNLILGLKEETSATDLDDVFDLIRVWSSETSECALRNLAKAAFPATLVSTPTFSAGHGFYTDDSSKYINNNFDLSTDAENYTLNSASVGQYIINAPASYGGKRTLGRLDATQGTRFTLSSPGTNAFFTINTAAGSNGAYANTFTANGFIIANRASSSSLKVYQNGSLKATASAGGNANSVGLPVGDVYTLAAGGDIAPLLLGTVAFEFYARGLSEDEIAGITTVVEQYMDALGIGVIA